MIHSEMSIDEKNIVLCQLTRAERLCYGIIIIHLVRYGDAFEYN
jgi:hypothetical protein